MIVAWHEVPGKLAERIRPVGYGMISVLNRIRSSRPIRYRTPRARYSLLADLRAILWAIASHHTVPYGTGSGSALPRHFVPGYYHLVPPGQRPADPTRNPEEPNLLVKIGKSTKPKDSRRPLKPVGSELITHTGKAAIYQRSAQSSKRITMG